MKFKSLSKLNKNLAFAVTFILEIIIFSFSSAGQEIETKIKLLPASRVRVEGKFLNPKTSLAGNNWSFLQNYADVSGLAMRIENLNLFDAGGQNLEVKKLIAGEFQTRKTAVAWQYEVKTDVPPNPNAAAHVSWLNDEHGLLMLGDLLPQWAESQPVSAKIIFELPAGWKIASGETKMGENAFIVKDTEKAVFLVGKNWRERAGAIENTNLSFAFSGEWQFSDAEAFEMANSILSEHKKIFRQIPAGKVQIFLLPFPQAASPERWRAEMRGSNLILISGAIPLKSIAIQRLHEQLRHELFHLWLPNGVNLSGNYDWFYEGFAVYQALRAGVALNQIRFQDFLDTLAQAFDLAQTKAGNRNLSLIEASNRRWLGANRLIYAKGMLAAFLCDAALLRQSKGRQSLTEIFQQVFREHQFPNKTQEGNAAILRILNASPELRPVAQSYIEGSSEINWANDLAAFGIETEKNGLATKLKISAKLDRRQKDLLDKLGYNQWRKLARKQN